MFKQLGAFSLNNNKDYINIRGLIKKKDLNKSMKF
jgi:hypothetical protein